MDRHAWDRLDGESSKAYAAFRVYRDQGPNRSLEGMTSTAPRWSSRWDWVMRAALWDDEIAMADDRRRLESIRTMHDNHQRAARIAIAKALAALQAALPEEIPAAAAARLLDLGTRLERETLIVSVEELQGLARGNVRDDPWEAIARELQRSRPND
jgi:hypothetical protein